MNLDGVIESLPSYAKDLKLNFSSVVRQQTELNEQQLWGTVVASAIASRNEQLIAAVLEEAATHLTPEALDAAKAAAAIMAMNNVFYRFKHLTSNEKYSHHARRIADERDAHAWHRSTRFRALGHGGVGDQQLRGLRGLP